MQSDTHAMAQILASAGQFVWAGSMSGSGWGEGAALAVDGEGNIHTTGAFAGTPDFDPVAGSFPVTSTLAGDGSPTNVSLCPS